MIDSHCHLEQKDFDKDRGELLKEWKKNLKAIVTTCACPKDWELTKKIVKENKGFVYAVAAVHPIYAKEVSDKEFDRFIEIYKKEAKQENLVGIGEVGLEYHHIKDKKLREKQVKRFKRFIELAKEVDLPLVVHLRDAHLEGVEILEKEGMKEKKVLLHMFCDNKLTKRVIENKWFISVGPGIQKSKTIRKIARDMPMDKILLETDSPWFGDGVRGTPLNVLKPAQKIAEIKKISIDEVEKQTDKNAIAFFGLSKLLRKKFNQEK